MFYLRSIKLSRKIKFDIYNVEYVEYIIKR